jgi:polyhydroxyalkanoate synthesis regulator phasin
MDMIKNFVYAGVGLATMTTDKIKETIDDLVEKGKISDTEGKKIIEDFLNSTEEKRTDFENKLKKTSAKISNTFDFNKKEKEMDLLKNRIKDLETEITNMKKKTKKTTTKTTIKK